MPKAHPREEIVAKAEVELREAVMKIRRFGLTQAERMQAINSVLFEEISEMLKYEIRLERHGRADKPGGWE